MAKNQKDTFIVAASPVYLKAVKGSRENGLARPKAIVVIFISKGYEGRLIKHVDLSHAGLMGRLNTNMNCLNSGYANQKNRKVLCLALSDIKYDKRGQCIICFYSAHKQLYNFTPMI